MTVYRYSWEDVSAGSVASSAFFDSTTEATGGTLRAYAAATANGAMGARCLTAASGAFAHADKAFTATSAISFTILYRQPATNPTSTQQRVIDIYSGGTSILRLDQNTDGRMLVRNSSGTTISAASQPTGTVAAAGTPMLWEVYVEPTGGYVSSRITNLATATAVVSSGVLTGQTLGGASTVDTVGVGWSIGSKAGVTEFPFDDVALDTAPGSRGAYVALGPAVVAATAGAVTASAVAPNVAGSGGNATVTAPAGAVTVAAVGPAVVGTQSATVTPLPGLVQVSAFGPSVTTSTVVASAGAGAVSVAATGPAVTATRSAAVTPPAGAVTVAAQSPSIFAGGSATVSVPTAAVTVAGVGPAVTAARTAVVSVTVATVTVSAVAPAVSGTTSATVTAPAGAASVAASGPVVRGGATLTAIAGAVSVYATAPGVSGSAVVSPPAAAALMVAYAPTVEGFSTASAPPATRRYVEPSRTRRYVEPARTRRSSR